MQLIFVILISSALVSGCAMWPSIKSKSDITSAAKTDYFCDKDENAKACANALNEELSLLIDRVRKQNWGISYTSLALATATGSVLTFGGGGDALKGLAIAAGSLLGINTIVDTKTQTAIYRDALKELNCVTGVYVGLKNSGTSISTESANYSSIFDQAEKNKIHIQAATFISTNATDGDEKKILVNHLIKQRVDGIVNFYETVKSTNSSADEKLRTAVNSIRNEAQLKFEVVSCNCPT